MTNSLVEQQAANRGDLRGRFADDVRHSHHLWQNDGWTPSSTMTRTIELPISEELLRLVDERAQTAGLRREAYIHAVLSKDVNGEPSVSGILAAFRDQVAGSGISDEELDLLFSQARDESYRERCPRRIDEP
jgi:hypothetical protein